MADHPALVDYNVALTLILTVPVPKETPPPPAPPHHTWMRRIELWERWWATPDGVTLNTVDYYPDPWKPLRLRATLPTVGSWSISVLHGVWWELDTEPPQFYADVVTQSVVATVNDPRYSTERWKCVSTTISCCCDVPA